MFQRHDHRRYYILLRRALLHKDMKKVADDLKRIYSSPYEEAALIEFERVSDIWQGKYPDMPGAWERN
jgi:transposase-like protein